MKVGSKVSAFNPRTGKIGRYRITSMRYGITYGQRWNVSQSKYNKRAEEITVLTQQETQL